MKENEKIDDTNSLFRIEAIEAQKTKSDGIGVIATPLSFYLLTGMILMLLIFTFVFINCVQYSRKELVQGRLVPMGNYAEVYSTKKGIIREVFVNEGQSIKEGEPIAFINSESYTKDGFKLTSLISSEINKTQEIIKSGLIYEKKITESVLYKLAEEIKFKNLELEGVISLLELKSKKRNISKSKVDKFKKLYQKKIISQNKYNEIYYDFLTDENEINRILNEKTIIESQVARMRKELEMEKLISQRKLTDLKLKLSEIKREEAISKSEDSNLVKAPLSGVISGLQVRKGQHSDTTTHLLTILPNNDALEVELFVPTKAISFVNQETIIKIRYDSFPYQKFGTFNGKVKSISKNVIKSNQLSGYTGEEEWLYKIVVTLSEEEYINKINLQPGMELSAYLLGEKRSIFEWIFEPLLNIKSNIL